ncbi:MAG: beta-ketoacyl-[acyl-carrier-protein] synthase family protein [Bacteroidales bacterium]|nr:beta-ketoacyl-[acyl-carrier-protein] synthase family protein [Bacteroidales bacterium]MDZ4059027.1 beta-ketoacyl-[acyl-carrier-protein] synthase family protein [Bacteroidales bacterium]
MARVVITGMGIYSCIGQNLDDVLESLREGRSGIGVDPEREEFGFRSSLTGILPKPDLTKVLDRRKRISMSQEAAYAYVATAEALKNAGIDDNFLDSREVGILYGNDSSALAVVEGVDLIREKKNTTLVGSGSVFQSMNSTVTMNLSVIFRLKGINLTIAGACASGSHSIGMGFMMIKNDLQDCIICGGAQEVNKYAVSSFDGLNAFSVRNDSPGEASRPFDADRDGLVPSGGAATVILESYESAIKRGAPILAEVLSYGFSSNGDHISVPNIDGPKRSLLMALDLAGVRKEEIGYINAHATSTPIGDYNEALAIDEVFGDHKPYVGSTKSLTGHEMWMAGASEIVYSVLMMKNSFIAPTINYDKADEASSRLRISNKLVNFKFDHFLSNSFGFGGTNSTLILKNIDTNSY